MSTPILISLGFLLVIVLLLYFKFNKNTKNTQENTQKTREENKENLIIPAEFQDTFDRGMNPTQYKECTFYTLINCVHCVRLEKFLESNNIPFTKVLLDNFQGQARKLLLEKVRSYNERGSFPTLVSPNEDVSVGFREAQVREKFIKYAQDNTDISDTK